MPPLRIDSVYPPRIRLKPGDVVMVHRECYNKDIDSTYMWKFLGAVQKVRGHGGSRLTVLRFGADEDKITVEMSISDPKYSIWFIPEEEWPDGVYAFRTRLILEGRLDEAVTG